MGFPSLSCKYALLALINKEALWSLVGQNIARWKFQTELEEERMQSQEFREKYAIDFTNKP